jgi:hypothetical protein
VLVRSSPNKANTGSAPWEDRWDGTRVTYFGDNKSADTLAWEADGNAGLVQEFALHSSESAEQRLLATPLLVFTGVTVGGRIKGNVRFDGLFIIEDVSLLWQPNPDSGERFSNFCFTLRPVSLGPPQELSTDWILDRSDPTRPADECVADAPQAWRRWVDHGRLAL